MKLKHIALIPMLATSSLLFLNLQSQDFSNNNNHAAQEAVEDEKTPSEESSTPTLSFEFMEKFFEKEEGTFVLLVLAFLFGVFVSFTPCVYPMIPITIGVLQSQISGSTLQNFLLSTFYVLGTATVYASLGYLVATTGLVFGQWFASGWFIAFVLLLLLYLAFAMFGFYEIYIPRILQPKKAIEAKGSLLYSFIAGILAGTAGSPCLSPALVILLSFAAKQANPVFGFLSLFSFSLGMGVLLIAIGTSYGALSSLPRAGSWMVEIKKLFGFLILATTLLFIEPLLDHSTLMLLVSLLLAATSAYYLTIGIKDIRDLETTKTHVEATVLQEVYLALKPNGFTYRLSYIKIIVGVFLALTALFIMQKSLIPSLDMINNIINGKLFSAPSDR